MKALILISLVVNLSLANNSSLRMQVEKLLNSDEYKLVKKSQNSEKLNQIVADKVTVMQNKVTKTKQKLDKKLEENKNEIE